MPMPHLCQIARGCAKRLTVLVLVVPLAAALCLLLATPSRADEFRAFGSAPSELRRLPPPTTSVDSVPEAVSFAALTRTAEPLSLGYDHGFVIAANQGSGNDASSVDFLMRVNSWMQLRQSVFESNGPNADQNTFSFERLRLSFGGHVLSPDVQYFFQLDGNSDRSTDAIFLDYFVTYDLGHDLLGVDKNRFGIKLGKWKVPFSRSRAGTGRQLQFSDRATANVFFDLNRSIGIGLSSKLDPYDRPGPFDGSALLEAAIFNGFKTGSTSSKRGEELDRNFGWSLRAHTDLLSDFGTDGEPDLSWHCTPAMRIGGGLAFTRVDVEGPTEFSRQRVVDSGSTLSSLLPVAVTGYDLWLYTIDTQLKYHGVSIIAEYYWRYMTKFNGAAVPSLLDDGFVLQTGYFVIAEKLELIARWSRISGDSGTLGLLDESSDEIDVGFVWYIKGHNTKVTFDASHYNGAPVSSSRLDLLPGDVGWLFRTQFQLAF